MLFLGDMVGTAGALFVAQWLRGSLDLLSELKLGAQLVSPEIVALVLLVWAVVFWTNRAYPRRGWRGLFGEWQALGRAIAVAALVGAGALYLSFRDVPRMLFVYFVLVDVVLLYGLRALVPLASRARILSLPLVRVSIIGTGHAAWDAAAMLAKYRRRGVQFVGFIADSPGATEKTIGHVDQLDSIISEHRITHLIVSSRGAMSSLAGLISPLKGSSVAVLLKPDAVDLAFERVGFEEFGGMPLLNLRPSGLREWQRVIKRLTDIVCVVMCLPLALPIVAIVAAAIRLDSRGPVLFRQLRLGENGRLFTMYKFRSMHADQSATASEPGGKRPDDPRITRVGRFIRSSSLDELPQLWNILRGDMSLVGPRPEVPELAERYATWQMQRFSVPQGLTGWWQVNGRSDRPMHLHTEDDIYYIQHYSPWLDLVIVAKTIPAVLSRRGAF